jgi:uncharacterized membrane protein
MIADEQSGLRTSKRVATLWVAAFVIAMFGVAWLVDGLAISRTWKMVASLAPMLLLIPMVRAVERSQRQCGAYSAATGTYNRRALIWSFSYVLLLVGAITANRAWHPAGALAWVIAILPALPVFFLIWSMGAYIVEETDEYLRQRTVISALWATGFLLALATCYGFLETFKLVPHVEGWAAVPVWAVGLGLGNLMGRRSA